MTSSMGHNSSSYWERLAMFYKERAEYLASLIRDPHLADRHRLVACEVAMRTNEETGDCYPGYARLIEDAALWGRVYSSPGMKKTLSELLKFNRLSSERKAPPGGKRALAHYRPIRLTTEELQAHITNNVMRDRRAKPQIQEQLPLLGGMVFDTTEGEPPGNVTRGGNVTPPGNISDQKTTHEALQKRAEVTRGMAAEVTRGTQTVTSKEGSLSSSDAPQAARRRRDLFDPIVAKKLEALTRDHAPDVRSSEEAWAILDGIVATFGVHIVEDAYWATESRKTAKPWPYFHKVLSELRRKRADEAKREAAQAASQAGQRGASGGLQPPAPPRPELSERDKLIQAMRACFPAGQMGQWHARLLGPRPGRPGCALAQADQNAVWRETLKRFGASVAGWQVMPLNVLGVCIHHQIVNAWKINPVTTPDFPIPADILAEFRVPRTDAELSAARTERQLWEAKCEADRAQKSNTQASSTA